MANEAVIIELLGKEPGRPVRFTCGDLSSLTTQGTLMKISDPRTIAASAADNDPFAGILMGTYASTDTKATVYTHGIFDLTNSNTAAIAAGGRVNIDGANTVGVVAAADLLFSDVGIALEDMAKQEVGAVLVGAMF